MNEVSLAHGLGITRRVDLLMRKIMMMLFSVGAVAILLLWVVESRLGLLSDICAVAYPLMMVIFVANVLLLHYRPDATVIARWVGFVAIAGLICSETLVIMWDPSPLVSNYFFVSIMNWFPLAYVIALFMLDHRHSPWAAGALFLIIAVFSGIHLMRQASVNPDDLGLLSNMLVSHLVLLACLGGLVKFKQAIMKVDAHSKLLVRQASTDPMTGLANRRYGLDRIQQAASGHSDDEPSTIMLCDIDYFKEINDAFGHEAGDGVVSFVATILRNSTRDVDTVVRWGGDEFLIVVPGAGAVSTSEMAERLRARVADMPIIRDENATISLSLSIGIAEMADGEPIEAWIKRADAALYQAKAAGRNRCVVA